MRILHVVGLIDKDGSYGGPTSVAMSQCSILEARGHDVTLLAGSDGTTPPPMDCRPRLFKAWTFWPGKFATLMSARAMLWGLRHARDFDVVHVHLARDLLTLPIAALIRARRRPYVLQTHGMVMPDRRPYVRLLDSIAVRPTLRGAQAVFALTDKERAGLVALGVSPARVQTLINGVPRSDRTAHFSEVSPRVVFVARLAERKRPVAFVEAAAHVLRERPDATFELWGPDEGQSQAVLNRIDALGLREKVQYRGPLERQSVPGLLAAAQVYVLPSYSEPFPVSLLEAMSVGLPSVITDDTGLSEACKSTGAAAVCDGSPEALAKSIMTLISDDAGWSQVSSAGRATIGESFSLDYVGRRLSEIYGAPTFYARHR